MQQGGGDERALGRHAVAALLNSTNSEVSYAFSTAMVISLVQDAYATGQFDTIKNMFEAENEEGCPLDRSPGMVLDRSPRREVDTTGGTQLPTSGSSAQPTGLQRR